MWAPLCAGGREPSSEAGARVRVQPEALAGRTLRSSRCGFGEQFAGEDPVLQSAWTGFNSAKFLSGFRWRLLVAGCSVALGGPCRAAFQGGTAEFPVTPRALGALGAPAWLAGGLEGERVRFERSP